MAEPTPRAKTAGAWLREQREAAELSVRGFATKVDVSTQMIYQWQDGVRPVSPEKANLIARALQLPASHVWERLGLTLPTDVEVPEVDRPISAEERAAHRRHRSASRPEVGVDEAAARGDRDDVSGVA